MSIGISSACFYPVMNTENTIEYMKNCGFSYGEIFLNTFSEYNDSFIDIIHEKSIKNDFKVYSMHSFSTSFEPFIFDRYSRRRDDMITIFEKLCKAIRKCGAKSYTFHGMRLIEKSSINMDKIIDIYNRISYIACENEIMLSQENVSWCMSSEPNYLEELIEKVKYPFYFTLDIKQSYKAGKTPFDYIDVMKGKINNIHINDKDKKNICLLPGKGDVDYKKINEKLINAGYKGPIIIEVYNNNFSNKEELSESRQYLENIFKNSGCNY